MLAFICDWCGAAYTDYPLCDQGTTLASLPKIKKPKDNKPDNPDVEIPFGTKTVSVGWTSSKSSFNVELNTRHVCEDCYNAYTEFVKSRKKD